MDQSFFRTWAKKIFSSKALDPSTQGALAQKSGLTLGQTDRGELVPIPEGLDLTSKDISFLKFWLDTYSSLSDERLTRYRTYEVMDSNSTEIGLMLDTYADEALAVGFSENPLKITIKAPKEIQDRIFAILAQAEFFKSLRDHVRSLAMYGDLFFHIYIPHQKDLTDIRIRKVNAADVDVLYLKSLNSLLGYKLRNTDEFFQDMNEKRYASQAKSGKSDALKPWEMCQFSLSDSAFRPYGKSLIERVRSAFDQLSTMEALYAIARANKIERLVVRVPTGNASNPTAAFMKLHQLRASFKSVILGSSGNRTALSKDTGLTDILWLPSGPDYGIEKLPSTVDLSSDEDVRYFLEKLMNGLRLPKGYLSTDIVSDRGSALSQQDLKFARSLIPVQRAFVYGVIDLCTTLGMYLGQFDIQVDATIEIPAQLSAEQVIAYGNQIQTALTFINSTIDTTTSPQAIQGQPVRQLVSPDAFVATVMEFGIPEKIAKLVYGILGINQNTNQIEVSSEKMTGILEGVRFMQSVTAKTKDIPPLLLEEKKLAIQGLRESYMVPEKKGFFSRLYS